MAFQAVFQRHELKYILTKEQKESVLQAIQPYMSLDQYGRTTIQNIYFDTENYRLIRRSIEKPDYKEKIRIRSYANHNTDNLVFVELKKKYQKVVYKRRLSMSEETAICWLTGECSCEMDSQIAREIEYFLSYYGKLKPSLFLSYEREAYYCKDGMDFRITFDENVRCRQELMTFQKHANGIPILENNKTLMEIKCSGGMPLWMAEILSREKIYKTSFSKYGTAYRNIIYPQLKGEQI
ncbi:MAG: polyphosphate polymerase domain-containing protein [Agathobacter sp.]|nr:polyphosphate polymerase domain-containing protein [Agathobacter sp.]